VFFFYKGESEFIELHNTFTILHKRQIISQEGLDMGLMSSQLRTS